MADVYILFHSTYLNSTLYISLLEVLYINSNTIEIYCKHAGCIHLCTWDLDVGNGVMLVGTSSTYVFAFISIMRHTCIICTYSAKLHTWDLVVGNGVMLVGTSVMVH